MEIRLSLSADIYYHGTKKKFSAFSEYRPAFFTKSLDYAKEYGPIIMEAHLDIKHVFDTRNDRRAVQIYNEKFLLSGLAQDGARRITLGSPVPFREADELWAYLAIPEYPEPHYDAIIVSEGTAGTAMHAAELSYVPLHVNQIKLVKS